MRFDGSEPEMRGEAIMLRDRNGRLYATVRGEGRSVRAWFSQFDGCQRVRRFEDATDALEWIEGLAEQAEREAENAQRYAVLFREVA